MNLKLFSVGITSIKLRPNSQNKAGLLCTRRQLNEHRIKLITACCLLASQLLHSLVARSPRVKKNKCLKQTNGKTHWVWSHPVCSKRVHKRPSRHVFCTDINEQIMSTVGKHQKIMQLENAYSPSRCVSPLLYYQYLWVGESGKSPWYLRGWRLWFYKISNSPTPFLRTRIFPCPGAE